MREIAAHTSLLVERLPRGAGRTGVRVVERDMVMNEVADRLHARPPSGGTTEQIPCDLGQSIGLAIATAQQKHQHVSRQILHGMLTRSSIHRIRTSAVVQDGRAGNPYFSLRSDKATAPIAEAIPV